MDPDTSPPTVAVTRRDVIVCGDESCCSVRSRPLYVPESQHQTLEGIIGSVWRSGRCVAVNPISDFEDTSGPASRKDCRRCWAPTTDLPLNLGVGAFPRRDNVLLEKKYRLPMGSPRFSARKQGHRRVPHFINAETFIVPGIDRFIPWSDHQYPV